MADKEVPDLTPGGPLQAGDTGHAVRGGNSREIEFEAQLPATRASSSGPASMQFAEDTDNGTNKITLSAPAALPADLTVTLPSAAGLLALVALLGMPYNVGLAASVSSNALTISLKGADGNDPSAANPVYFPFRSSSAGAGAPVVRSAESALSLTISSGSTMGFTSAKNCRLWIVVVDDAGTLRLGAINALGAANIFPLRDQMLMSSTAEGGAGAADSAGVLYTGTAVTSKPIRIIGYMDFSLTTAGTWNEVPDVIQLFGPGVPSPGEVVQRSTVTSSGSSSTSTSLVDVTGASVSLTPISAANPVLVSFGCATQAPLVGGTNTIAYVDLLRGSTVITPGGTSGLNVETATGAGGNRTTAGLGGAVLDKPDTAASVTYKLQHRTSSGSGSVVTSGVSILAQELMG